MYLETIHPAAIILLGLASFRLTRLIVYDKITEFFRRPFFNEIEKENEEGVTEIYLLPKDKGIKRWIGELLSCFWCTGIWVSIFLYGLYLLKNPAGDAVILILSIAAIGSVFEVVVTKIMGD
ncbi:Protein of unknown function [Bacillus sp. OV322]|uniref:DUF1360 domain-containing protein n=1 Tax=Bacillus sp. OV322 TaxID=1882764 RepID=UPI0008E23542|nr:DUF1360 domain-containing protein [Bacillus sp. OV322]SFB98302.1 Protein of unknown function [Bacillus sp. OV322]